MSFHSNKEKMDQAELIGCIEHFNALRTANHRYASFDYCFNYFQSFENKNTIASREHIEMSCLHLGFYLASWGMLRGSSDALEHSLTWLVPVIKIIAESPETLWLLDVDGYNEETLGMINFKYNQIAQALEVQTHLTLVTKIMLGVYGCVPAFDRNVKAWHRSIRTGKQTFTQKLEGIGKFYNENKDTIDELAKSLNTIDFKTGHPTNHCYTKAKVIDMIGFEIGKKIVDKKPM